MQFQADVLQRPVRRSRVPELSGFGAAVAAGQGLGFWRSGLGTTETQSDLFAPKMSEAEAADAIAEWQKAVEWTNTNY